MRLINVRTYGLEEFFDNATPAYAILSHTWADEEVLIHDMRDLESAKRKKGFKKIAYACSQAYVDHLRYVWVDTCCIDKTSSAELQEAINSMFRWYKLAVICYAYLEDVLSSCIQLTTGVKETQGPVRSFDSHYLRLDNDAEEREFWLQAVTGSRWFTRGWTLQELIAPSNVAFFGCDWDFIGTRGGMLEPISKATKIDKMVLAGSKSLSSVSIANKMMWAANRKTSRIEDQAYSLLGLFDVNMPMLYGEGHRAFTRLQEEIMKTCDDHSILAWQSHNNGHGALLAESPSDFAMPSNIVSWGLPTPLEMARGRLRASLPLLQCDDTEGDYLAILNCRAEDNIFQSLALRVRPYRDLNTYRVVGRSGYVAKVRRLALVHAKRFEGIESSVIEITHRLVSEGDVVKSLKLCIRLAENSSPAEITESENIVEDVMFSETTQIARGARHVVAAPASTIDGKFSALIKFESGEEIVVVLAYFNRYSVDPNFSFGVHVWFVDRESGQPDLAEIIRPWKRHKRPYPFPHDTSFTGRGKQVSANVAIRTILGERIIMANVSVNDQ